LSAAKNSFKKVVAARPTAEPWRSPAIDPLGTYTNQSGSTRPILAVAGYDDISNNQALILW
jgi:hypothetical protein